MGALIAALIALVLAVVAASGYSIAIKQPTWWESWMAWGIPGLWFLFLILIITPYRMWRDQSKRIDEKEREVVRLQQRLIPMLSLSFESRPPWIDRIDHSNIPIPSNPNNKAPSIWYSVKVENSHSGTVAKAVRVSITKIEYLEGRDYINTRFSASQPLRWALSHDMYKPVDIPSGEIWFANVVSVDPVHNKIDIKWPPPGWKAYERIFERHGRYRLTVIVRSSEGVGDSIRLIMDWDGNWEQVKMDAEA